MTNETPLECLETRTYEAAIAFVLLCTIYDLVATYQHEGTSIEEHWCRGFSSSLNEMEGDIM